MRGWLALTLSLAASLSFFSPDAVAAPANKDRPSREVRESLRAVEKFFKAYPERRADYLPPGIAPAQLGDEIVVEYRTRDGAGGVTRLNNLEATLVDFGASLRALDDRDNLVRLYGRIYDLLPSQFRGGLPLPAQVAARRLPEVQRAYGALLQRVDTNFPTLVDLLAPAAFLSRVTNPIGRCDAEVGDEYAGPHSEISGRCEIGEYGVNGLIRNFSFPLENDLTCVRNQGERGTCGAFGALGTVESLAMTRGALAATLSEQHFYYLAETEGDAQISLEALQTYGISLHIALEAYVANGSGVHYESDWNYNRSLDMGAIELDPALLVLRHPDSCGLLAGDYTGESCSDFPYQTPTTVAVPGAPQPGAAPAMSPAVHTIVSYSYLPAGPPDVTEGSLQTAVMLLAADVPVVVATLVTQQFTDTVDGYVLNQPGEPVTGGHYMELVGFVPNDELPASIAPATAEGYFIAKNSWGIGAGDCGFLYLDYGYLREHLDAIAVIDIQ